MSVQGLKWTFESLRYCEAGGWGLLGAPDPSAHSQRVPGGRHHLSGGCQAGLMCVTSHRTPGMLR